MNKATLVLLLLLIMLSCSKEDKFDYPVVFIGDVINLTDTSATYTANITNLGNHKVIESGFVWGLHSLDNNGIKIKNEGTKVGAYELPTNYKFLPGKTYYVRAYVQTESEITYSKEISFNISGQINNGQWSPLLVTEGFGDSYTINVLASFTFNDTTFFALEDGTLHYYSHVNNTQGLLLSNPLFTEIRFSAAYNGFAYLFIKNDFYRFDCSGKTLTKLNTNGMVPKDNRVYGFIINDNIYLGNLTTSGDFWKFSITGETWEQINSFPGTYLSLFSSFSLMNTGYLLGFTHYPGSQNFGLWQYIPDNDQWIMKHIYIKEYISSYVSMSSATLTDLGYCGSSRNLYEYNPIFDIFEKMVSMPYPEYPWIEPHLFTAYDKVFDIYFGKKSSSNYLPQLWVYEK